MAKRIEDNTAPDKHVYYAHGPNCWGRALTIHKAIAEARFNLPTELKRKRWNEWEINLVPWPTIAERGVYLGACLARKTQHAIYSVY